MIDLLCFPDKPKILVVDDTLDDLMLIDGLLHNIYKIKIASSGENALKIAESENVPDLILLDVMMPDIDGYEVCRRLKQNTVAFNIPVIFLTSKSSYEDETKGLELGAVDYITKPINPSVLLSRVKTHLKIKFMQDSLRDQKAWFSHIIEFAPDAMLVIDENDAIVLANSTAENLFGYQENELLSKKFYELLASDNGIRKDGHEFAAEIKRKSLPKLNNNSACVCVLVRDVTMQKREETRIKKLAFYDGLTGLPNRRKLLDYLNSAISIGVRENHKIAILMMDLDKFKAVNDTFGHSAGDDLLKQVAERVTKRLRESDLVARLGGDEFVVVLRNIHSLNNAPEVANEIISNLTEPFLLSEGETVQIGASIGISFYPQHGNTPATLIDRADVALYRAKENGRGQFCIF